MIERLCFTVTTFGHSLFGGDGMGIWVVRCFEWVRLGSRLSLMYHRCPPLRPTRPIQLAFTTTKSACKIGLREQPCDKEPRNEAGSSEP